MGLWGRVAGVRSRPSSRATNRCVREAFRVMEKMIEERMLRLQDVKNGAHISLLLYLYIYPWTNGLVCIL